MNKKNLKKLARRKRRIARRLGRDRFPEDNKPVLRNRMFRYEMSDKVIATKSGGVAAMHEIVRKLELDKAINHGVPLLKLHLPYYESDHILSLVYNVVNGGTCLEDLERLREDEALLNMLGADRIPDPTTSGDFLRRFSSTTIERLMEVVNEKRRQVWSQQTPSFRKRGTIDVDGSTAPSDGEKKEGMDFSYKGVWSYHPLIVSLAETQEPLYMVNRPGNVPSHQGSSEWIDKALDLCEETFEEIWLRGDTDFSLTYKFDEWDKRARFVFGKDACKPLINRAEELGEGAYRPLHRRAKYEVQTQSRSKRENAKEQKVIERNYKNIKLRGESIAEFKYQPGACKKSYRMIVLRKDLSVGRGEPCLFPNEVRYYFYITNAEELSAEEVVFEANARCNQENLIEQLKNGVNAIRVPAYDLNSNWAYMVIVSIAWTLKAWFGLLQPKALDKKSVLRMEFKRFITEVIQIPAQVYRSGRQVGVRLLAYTGRVRLLFSSLRATRSRRFT